MPSGGYREPANPAPVSGPGAMSRRTDGGQPVRDPGGLPYGDNQELRTAQSAAPMAGTSPGAAGTPLVGLADMSPNLTDPTNHPERSVFTGMPFGPGAGPEVLGNAEQSQMARSRLTNNLPTLLRAAESPHVSPEFRALVAMVRDGAIGG